MSGETEGDVSAFTVDSLHVHLSRRLNDLEKLLDERAERQEKAIDAALVSAEKAVTKAEVASEKRFDAVNEFRQTVTDITSNNVAQGQHDSDIRRVEDQVTALKERLDQATGRGQGYAALYGWAVAGLSVLVAVVVLANALFSRP